MNETILHQLSSTLNTMKFVIFTALVAVALADYSAPSERRDTFEQVGIVRDNRDHEDDGTYNFDFEGENGIRWSESGSPDGVDNAIVSAGEYSYTAPDGTDIVVKYIANENGFQPQSDILPVAPAFPHPIPQFVLDQIAFAAEEDARKSRDGSFERQSATSTSNGYRAPQ